MAHRPLLWRAARAFRILSALWLVAVVAFLVSVAYSGAQLRPGHETGPNTPPTVSGNNTVTLTGELNVSNPGWYPLNDVSLFTIVDDPNGTVLATGGSPATTVGAGGVTTVPFTISIGFDARSAARALLTHDAILPSTTWANATYVGLFRVQVIVPLNVTWGAPLANLSVRAGNATVLPNGTAAVSLTVSFADHARFPVDGRAVYTLGSNGVSCARGTLPVNVAGGQAYDRTTTAYLGPGCAASGATLTLRFLGAGWALSPAPVVLR
ncbi:MAG TPA: hypothetical protein VJQ43_04855 [Thermoplasmata archaeon]|nr:hypothetical protein [Thermoplasmata archaeon]